MINIIDSITYPRYIQPWKWMRQAALPRMRHLLVDKNGRELARHESDRLIDAQQRVIWVACRGRLLEHVLLALEPRHDDGAGGIREYIDRGARHVEQPIEHEQHADGLGRKSDRGQYDCDADQ